MRSWLTGLGVIAGLALAGCEDEKCDTVTCGYTHVLISVVDTEGEVGHASAVTFTFHPLNEDGDELMTEDELDEANVDPDLKRKASCSPTTDDEEICDTWIAEAGFGQYTITGSLKNDEGTVVDDDQVTVTIAVPSRSENQACCGLVATETATLTLEDPEG